MNADNGVDDGGQPRDVSSDDVDLSTLLDVDDATAIVEDISTVESVDWTLPSGVTPPDRLSSILVAIGDGPHSGATVDLAAELACASGAWLELFHVLPVDGSKGKDDGVPTGTSDASGTSDATGTPDPTASSEALLSTAEDRVGECEWIDTWLLEGDSPASEIVEQSAYYDAVVLGAPTSGRVERFVLGSTTGTVRSDADCPVVVVTAEGSTPIVHE